MDLRFVGIELRGPGIARLKNVVVGVRESVGGSLTAADFETEDSWAT